MKPLFYSLATASALALGAGSAVAGDDLTRQQLEQLIDLDQVIQVVEDQYPDGRIVEAELDDDRGGTWEIKLIDAQGKKQKLKLDAKTGEPVQKAQKRG